MDFDNGYDDYDDYGNQEEIWDYGFDDTPDSLLEDQDLPPEPRTAFRMPWQAVLSLQHLPGGKVQASVRHWPRCLVEAGRYTWPTATIPCPHCKFYCASHADLADEKMHHRRIFIEDNQRRAEEKQRQMDSTERPKRQRGRKGRGEQKKTAGARDEQELEEVARAMALISFGSFCDSRPAEQIAEVETTKRRRPRNKKSGAKTSNDMETSTPTTKQSDPRDPVDCHGFNKKESPPRLLQSSAMDSALEDNATSATTTAEMPQCPSLVVSSAHLSLV